MANAKGLIFVELVKLLRANRDAATALLPKDLHGYLDEWIVMSKWYPESDFAELLRAGAKLSTDDPEDTLRAFGRYAAEVHARELYPHLLVGAPEAVVLSGRLVSLWEQQHDTGRMSLRVVGASRAQIDLEGYAGASFETCQVSAGYLLRLLQLSGLPRLSVIEAKCRRSGDPICRWEAIWS